VGVDAIEGIDAPFQARLAGVRRFLGQPPASAFGPRAPPGTGSAADLFCDRFSSAAFSRNCLKMAKTAAVRAAPAAAAERAYTTESFDLQLGQPEAAKGLIGQGLMAACASKGLLLISSFDR